MTTRTTAAPDVAGGHVDTGVLTFHRCINNGSYWQARCLIDGLRARGRHAVVLDHRSARVDRVEWRCALRPTLPTWPEPGDRHLYRRKIERFLAAIEALPTSEPFDLDHPCATAWPETVVVGSDEVWNPSHPWYGGVPLFFGAGIRADRLVAYAASAGNHDASWGLPQELAGLLQGFDAISVRDDNSHALVAAALGAAPEVVLDPCLQFPPALEGAWAGPEQPYVLVYGHNFSDAAQRGARRFADACGVRLLSVSYRNDWADDQWIDAGPHDFAHAVARSTAVVTNFFHGCVFSLLHNRPFACETSPYRHHKVRGLMADLGGERHLLGEHDDDRWDEVLGTGPSGAIHDAVRERRARSGAFLDRALGSSR